MGRVIVFISVPGAKTDEHSSYERGGGPSGVIVLIFFDSTKQITEEKMELSNVYISATGAGTEYGQGERRGFLYDYIEVIENSQARKINHVMVPEVVDAGFDAGAKGTFYLAQMPQNMAVNYLYDSEVNGITRIDNLAEERLKPANDNILIQLIGGYLPSGWPFATVFFWAGFNLITLGVPGFLLFLRNASKNKQIEANYQVTLKQIKAGVAKVSKLG
jgi:hypothetical protein